MEVKVKVWIEDAPDVPFINRNELLKEFCKFSSGKRKFDSRVWRWINYLRWVSLMGVYK